MGHRSDRTAFPAGALSTQAAGTLTSRPHPHWFCRSAWTIRGCSVRCLRPWSPPAHLLAKEQAGPSTGRPPGWWARVGATILRRGAPCADHSSLRRALFTHLLEAGGPGPSKRQPLPQGHRQGAPCPGSPSGSCGLDLGASSSPLGGHGRGWHYGSLPAPAAFSQDLLSANEASRQGLAVAG